MSCQACGAQMVWRGSMSRGSHVCPMCDPSSGKSKVMRRYDSEKHAWHRDWCSAIRAKTKGRTDPKLCDCGHEQDCPYTDQQIEQRERAIYGDAV